MKRFLIDTSVENAEGTQTWFVDAETEQEALDKFSSGACDLYESNVEVTRCGEPEISGEVPLDDFGRFAEEPPEAQPAVTEGWVAVSDRLPIEDDGEVLVRMRDGRHEIAWATYWHGASNAFARWSFRDPDEYEDPTHWMKIAATPEKGGA